jgi:replication factor A1
MAEDKPLTKVKELTPDAKQTNVLVKVVNIGERRTIDSKFGGSRQLAEATVGDETGTILLSLWETQIDQVQPGQVVLVDNGYVSLVRGHMRLNVGKYGSFAATEQDIPEVNSSVDVSAQEFERPQRYERRSYGFGGRDFGGGGGRSGGSGGSSGSSGSSGGGGGRRDDDRGGRDRGRRRF